MNEYWGITLQRKVVYTYEFQFIIMLFCLLAKNLNRSQCGAKYARDEGEREYNEIMRNCHRSWHSNREKPSI